MFVINCPYCGEREQSEFKAGGEAHIVRPKQPTELSDDQWADFLFMRKPGVLPIFLWLNMVLAIQNHVGFFLVIQIGVFGNIL